MRINRLMTSMAFTMVLGAAPVLAQQKPDVRTTPPPASAQPNVPESKVALINSDAFDDEKQGILRIVQALKRVNDEFREPRDELVRLQQKSNQLEDEIERTINVADPSAIRKKQADLAQMKKDLQRKQEDGQAAYNRRMQELLGPIYEDVGKALDAFAKARGITLLLDSSKIGPAILSAAAAMDVTEAFITDFNRKNPITASVTPPQ